MKNRINYGRCYTDSGSSYTRSAATLLGIGFFLGIGFICSVYLVTVVVTALEALVA